VGRLGPFFDISTSFIALSGSIGGDIAEYIEVIELALKKDFVGAGKKLLDIFELGPDAMLGLAAKALNIPVSGGSILDQVNAILDQLDLSDEEADQVSKMDTDEVLEWLFNKAVATLDTKELSESFLQDLIVQVAIGLGTLIAVQLVASLNPVGGVSSNVSTSSPMATTGPSITIQVMAYSNSALPAPVLP